jgi:LysM repeat protein
VFKPSEVPLNHEVAASDTTAGIAALYDLTISDLMRLNPGLEVMHTGQVLKLRSYASAAANTVFEPIGTSATFSSYTVKSGDTLMAISRNTGVALEKLMAANGLDSSSIIRIGMKDDGRTIGIQQRCGACCDQAGAKPCLQPPCASRIGDKVRGIACMRALRILMAMLMRRRVPMPARRRKVRCLTLANGVDVQAMRPCHHAFYRDIKPKAVGGFGDDGRACGLARRIHQISHGSGLRPARNAGHTARDQERTKGQADQNWRLHETSPGQHIANSVGHILPILKTVYA